MADILAEETKRIKNGYFCDLRARWEAQGWHI